MKKTGSLILLCSVLVLGGCATGNNPRDPYEGFNRAMFTFNDTIDRAAIKPAAEAYDAVLPLYVQNLIGNFFGNLGDVWSMVNNFLQGKGAEGMSDVMRVTFNSTIGFGGLLDIASEAGLVKHKEDFGQTLGTWGVKSGPYVVLPFFGPSTVRDTAALPVDMAGDIWMNLHPVDVRNSGAALRLVDQRAALLDASSLLEDAALDRYTFVRGAYLQRRASMVYDGDVPAEEEIQEPVLAPGSDASQLETGAEIVALMEPAEVTPVESDTASIASLPALSPVAQ